MKINIALPTETVSPMSLKARLTHQSASQTTFQKAFYLTVLGALVFGLNTKAALPDSTSVGDPGLSNALANPTANSTVGPSGVNALRTRLNDQILGKWMKLDAIQNVNGVGLDGTFYKGTCSQAEVENAFSFNSQEIGNAAASPILTSHPHLCSNLNFNSVMYFPAEAASAEKIHGSPEQIVLAQVEGHPAMQNIDEGKSTMHVVRGVRLKAKCEIRNRSKMMGMLKDTLMDCQIAEGGTGTLTFVLN